MGYLLGRGLVEPIDDMRATNPPSNAELLDALADDFAKSGFNVKHLMRTIMNSRLYQLDSQPTAENAADSRFYSHYQVKRLPAEPLLDAIDAPPARRPSSRTCRWARGPSSCPTRDYPNYFLKTFGKPRRASVCECERSPTPTWPRRCTRSTAICLANKIGDANGRVAKLLAANKPLDENVAELYLATWSRRPTPEELAVCKSFLDQAPTRRRFTKTCCGR